jgi:uncharacterized protein involved in exopolysaccharide biosynthesis
MQADIGADAGGGRQVREYLAALRRRKWQILAVAVPLALVALVVAYSLPPVYRSTATILVQEQEVPQDLVRSTITSFADERIQVISQQVMTRAVLLRLVSKFNLYEDMRATASDDAIAERMRKDIHLTTITADMSDRGSGRRVNATIAFTIAYDAPSPERAQQVANELVTLYLNENVKARQQSVAETAAFLAQEADRLARQIQAIEGKLAEFKRRNVGRLPESSSINVQLAERTEAELQRVERELSILQDRKASLEAQMAIVSPTLPPPPVAASSSAQPEPRLPGEERLRALQGQYATASANYGADHPDVRRLQREIAALKAEVGASAADAAAEQRSRLESELVVARQRYGEDHPDVQRLRRSIAALPAGAAASATPGAATTSPLRATPAPVPAVAAANPVYTMLVTQLDGVNREIKQLSGVRDDLRAKLRTYDARLLQLPEVEREYRELTRDYGNAQTRYQEIKNKQLQAEGALELERDLKAERFSLGEPANLPSRAHTPNRPRIALAGLVLAFGAGFGLALARELLDTSVKGPLELARIASAPILTAIPYIDTHGEVVGKRRRAVAVAALVVVLATAFFVGVHTFVKPLPALVDTALGHERGR